MLALALAALALLPPPLPTARPNDNRVAAGVNAAGKRRVQLVAQRVRWFPVADDGPSIETVAFGEEGKAPQIPAPLIRVRRDVPVDATVRNALDEMLVVYVQVAGTITDSILVAPGATRTMPVKTDRAGTFVYGTQLSRKGALVEDEPPPLAGGAIVVDSTDAPAADRVIVLQTWVQRWDTTGKEPGDRLIMTFNGKMWPRTERFHFTVGDTVRWRLVSLDGGAHPMHLHGFYFRVDSRGDGATDSVYTPAQRRWAVTESLQPFGTFTLTWVPERPGNWLFHCHKGFHMSGFMHNDLAGERFDYNKPAPHAGHESDANHLNVGMAGLALGIEVAPRTRTIAVAAPAPVAPAKRLRLFAQKQPGIFGLHGYVLQSGDSVPAVDSVQVPGPPLVLTRGEPVEITVRNRLDAPTGVHWHGIELDSYFDGVGGWSGAGTRVAPRVAPNDSFVVRFTPPRAGTFMYHSHNEEVRQIGLGMYGAIVVLPPGQAWDPKHDHLLVLGDIRVNGDWYAGLNGAPAGYPIRLSAGTHRLRLVNILVDDDATVAIVDSANGPLSWRPLAKDGADLPDASQVARPSTTFISPGETYDVEFTAKPGRYRLRVESYSHLLVDIIVR